MFLCNGIFWKNMWKGISYQPTCHSRSSFSIKLTMNPETIITIKQPTYLYYKYGTHRKSVHSIVNHCNQVYSYPTVFFYIWLLLQMQWNKCKLEIQSTAVVYCTIYTSALYYVWQMLVHGRAVVSGGAGVALAPPEFRSSVNPIPTRGGRLCAPHYS